MPNVPCTFSLHFSFRRRGSLTQLITFTKCISIISQRDISVFVSSVFSSLSLKFLEHLNDCTPRVCYSTAAVKAARLGRIVVRRMQRNAGKYWKLGRCYIGIIQGFRCERQVCSRHVCDKTLQHYIIVMQYRHTFVKLCAVHYSPGRKNGTPPTEKFCPLGARMI